jgi:hypothetical protein
MPTLGPHSAFECRSEKRDDLNLERALEPRCILVGLEVMSVASLQANLWASAGANIASV